MHIIYFHYTLLYILPLCSMHLWINCISSGFDFTIVNCISTNFVNIVYSTRRVDTYYLYYSAAYSTAYIWIEFFRSWLHFTLQHFLPILYKEEGNKPWCTNEKHVGREGEAPTSHSSRKPIDSSNNHTFMKLAVEHFCIEFKYIYF